MNTIVEPLTEPFVLREEKAGVVTLTLNRPQQYNALSQDMMTALQTELNQIAQDNRLRVVIIAARGKAFCAGHDLKQLYANREQAFCQALFTQCSKLMLTINQLPQPVIAKVQGLATAGGCQLVAACDLAIAAETAQFATSGINVGLFCATPAVPLSRAISRKPALEMLFTGEFITAHLALQYGLINRVVPTNQLEEATQQLVDAIVSKPAAAIALGKQMFYKQLDMGINDAYCYASDFMVQSMLTDEVAEGIAAFMQKRKPQWKE